MRPKLISSAVLAAALGLSTATALAVDPPKPPETEHSHIQNLRSVRKTLNETRKMLKDEPMADGDTNRPAALKAMETAIDCVNKEVEEYEHKHPESMKK